MQLCSHILAFFKKIKECRKKAGKQQVMYSTPYSILSSFLWKFLSLFSCVSFSFILILHFSIGNIQIHLKYVFLLICYYFVSHTLEQKMICNKCLDVASYIFHSLHLIVLLHSGSPNFTYSYLHWCTSNLLLSLPATAMLPGRIFSYMSLL